jgi:4-hydroxybenzoate polyprenyltransferase
LEFVYGAHLLALGAAALVITAAVLLDEPISVDYPAMIYLAAYSAYLYNRYKEFNADFATNRERVIHFRKYARYTPAIMISVSGSIVLILRYSAKLRDPAASLPILLIYFGGLLYSTFGKRVTKKILAFKNFFVALEYSLPLIFLPLYYSFSFRSALLLLAFFTFFKVFILTSYFDIKDATADARDGLRTLPAVWGLGRSLRFLGAAVVLWGLLILLAVFMGLVPAATVFLLLIIPYNFLILLRTARPYASLARLYFLAGGELLLWPVLIYFGKIVLPYI